MNARELILLSPYRLPAQDSLMLANEDVGCILNGYTALWHPAAVRGATGPPRIASPYDHEEPAAGHIYAVPESPPLILPDDWDQRVINAGAVAFRCTPEREWTLSNLLDALRKAENSQSEGQPTEPPAEDAGAPPPAAPSSEVPQGGTEDAAVPLPNLYDLGPEKVKPFFGIGFGYLMVETLFEAMEHENLLATSEVWQDVQQAVAALGDPDGEAFRRHLQAAADKLLSAREVLYPVTVHVVDIAILDQGRLGEPLPAALEYGQPLNLVAAAALLQHFGREYPERLASLREKVQAEQVEICGGPYQEREDALLPVESQLWNLLRGKAVYKELLGTEIHTFARKRFAAHPQLPLFLSSAGMHRAIMLAFDNSVLPTYRTTVTSWPSPDGKQVEAFTRTPYAADNPQTWFHLAHYLRQTIQQDHAATLALLHHAGPAALWYEDWLELQRFGPILGQWTTLSRYFTEVMSGEYASAANADEFHSDYLEERTNARVEQPVSWFARQARWRRRVDAAWTLAALLRGLRGAADASRSEMESLLAKLEEQIETGAEPGPELLEVEKQTAEALAERLLSRAQTDQPGYLVLNPCSFTRRVALEVDGLAGPLPVEGPLKAAQFDGGNARLVVVVPAFGFAWIPRSGPAGTPPPASRMCLADKNCVRNEFFEAEIDPQTGGLRALRDHRTRINRIGQQLVYNPGSVMRLREVKVTSTGPALGELITEGALLDEQDQVLANFRQRYRAWVGRPLLEMRIEIFPTNPPQGYPWHNYYGARFAWRDERAAMLRGVNGTSYITAHTRPETPDYLELRLGRQATTLFPGGLPFHQRHGPRMLDVILLAEGESAQSFDIGVGLDRETPMQTALGIVSPMPLVPTTKGPPHIGATGWLFHLDAPNLAVTSLRPAPDGADAVVARLLECSAHTGPAEFRFVRDPRRAVLLDAAGGELLEANISGDAVLLDVAAGDLALLRVEFS
jgi:hypothetical protein